MNFDTCLATFQRVVDVEDIVEPEWLDWYQKSPLERFYESQRLMAHYLGMGGSLAPDIDHESPFWSREDFEEFAKDIKTSQARAGISIIERK